MDGSYRKHVQSVLHVDMRTAFGQLTNEAVLDVKSALLLS